MKTVNKNGYKMVNNQLAVKATAKICQFDSYVELARNLICYIMINIKSKT